jgi:hypothetical protein
MTIMALGMGLMAIIFFVAGIAVIASYGAVTWNRLSDRGGTQDTRNWRRFVLSPERIEFAIKAQPEDDDEIARLRRRLKQNYSIQLGAFLVLAILGTIMTTMLE